MDSKTRKIAVQDACILFDLVDLTLLNLFFRLDFEVFTTPQIIGEIKTKKHRIAVDKHIKDGRLIIDSYGTLEDVFQLFGEESGLSLEDCSVLELAIRKEAILFSSDGRLRKISNRRNITVRGTLWIIEHLYLEDMITLETAIEKLELLEKVNERAPTKEIKKMILRLKES
jgi:rRNA maturation endonuclease Nob1